MIDLKFERTSNRTKLFCELHVEFYLIMPTTHFYSKKMIGGRVCVLEVQEFYLLFRRLRRFIVVFMIVATTLKIQSPDIRSAALSV